MNMSLVDLNGLETPKGWLKKLRSPIKNESSAWIHNSRVRTVGRELNDGDNSNDGNRSWARGTEP